MIERRVSDVAIHKLAEHAQVNQLKIDLLQRQTTAISASVEHLHACMEKNTEITEQVRDILASFRIVARMAKWFTAIGGAVATGIAIVKAWR